MYKIMRHSGHTRTSWRVLLKTNNRFKAQACFNAAALKMRQGTVQLHKDAEIISVKWAPHLRMHSKRADRFKDIPHQVF
jgi:hypothetical protein